MIYRFNMRFMNALAVAGFLAFTAASCGLDSKVNELVNPPVPKTIPEAGFTASKETAKVGTPIIVDASSSLDPQGQALTYAWTLEVPTGSTAKLGSATASTTSFTPDKGGYYMVSLVVTNTSGKASGVATLRVNIVGTGSNHPPVAITTAAVSVTTGNAAVLNGSQSYDLDQQTLYYTWTLLSAPATSAVTTLSDNTTKTAYFTPDVVGTYNVKFVVSDGTDSDQALVTITVTAQTAQTVPTASFTADNSTVKLGTPVRLDATASSDPQGKTLTYTWTLTPPKGSLSTLGSSTAVITSFTPDKGGIYIVYLKVKNSASVASEPATLPISAVGTGTNYPPVAITTASLSGTINSLVTLDGSRSYDADQQTLYYTWTLISAPATSAVTALTDSSAKTAYFTPDVAGTYNMRLVVSDGIDSDQANVKAQISAVGTGTNHPPVAVTTTTLSGTVNTVMFLDGSQSYDIDNQTLTYAWTIVSPATGATLTNPTTNKPDFKATVAGTYILKFVVSDGIDNSQLIVTITVA